MPDAGHRRAARFLGAGLVVLLAACGEPPADGPARAAPPDLEALRAIDDPEDLDAALAAWPIAAMHEQDPESARRVLTWRLRRHAAAHRIEAALEDLGRLRTDFDGEGHTLEGHLLDADLLAAGLTEAALAAARQRIEGSEPDRAATDRALAVAEELQGDLAEDELAEALEGTRRWCRAERLDDLGLDLPAPEVRAPRAVLLADAFALGPTATLPLQWARWRQDAPDAHLELVPLTRGFVMAGIRRVPTRDPAAEVQAMRQAVAAASPTVHAPVPGRRLEQTLALAGSDSAVLLLDADDRIVARASGAHLDLQRLEGAWQRLARSDARGRGGN